MVSIKLTSLLYLMMISFNTTDDIKSYIMAGGDIQNGFIFEDLIMELTIATPSEKIFADEFDTIVVSIKQINRDVSVNIYCFL